MTYLPIQQQLIEAFRDTDRVPRLDFVGLGFAKAGTTWLFEMLKEHPEIYMATKQSGDQAKKEFNVWSGSVTWMSAEDYAAAIRLGSGKVCGEFSTTYTTPLCIRAIHEALLNARLLWGIRNPVTMLYSAFTHELRSGGRYDDYRDYHNRIILPLGEQSWLDGTLDALGALPPDFVHIYCYENLVADPATTLSGLYRFLGVDPSFRPTAMTRRYNMGYRYRSRLLHILVMEMLVSYFGHVRGKRFFDTPHLRPRWVNFVIRLNEKAAYERAIPGDDRRFLVEQTRDTCRKTLDRFGKWRDWGYEPRCLVPACGALGLA